MRLQGQHSLPMTRVFVVVLLVLIDYSHQQQSTTLFNCTFDRGLVDDCVFHGLIPPGDHLESDMGQQSVYPLTRPLSDATSVFTPTANGEMCQLPYKIDEWPLHFCHYDENSTDYLCPTKSEQQAKCAQGQYGYKSTSSPTGFLAIYKSNTSIAVNSSEEKHCLSFYYYFTDQFRPSSIIFRMHSDSNTTRSQTIVTVNPNNESKWYYSETTFTTIAEQYYLVFVLLRNPAPDDPSNFTFALDNISIINGTCPSMATTSLTTFSSASSQTSTESTDVTTYAIDTTVTEPTARTTEHSSVYTEPISTTPSSIMTSMTMTTEQSPAYSESMSTILSSITTSTTLTTTVRTSTDALTDTVPFPATTVDTTLTTTVRTSTAVLTDTVPFPATTADTTLTITETTVTSTVIVIKETIPTDSTTQVTTSVGSTEAETTVKKSSTRVTDMIRSTTVTTSTMTSSVETTTPAISSTTTSKSTSTSVIIGLSVGLGVPALCIVIIGAIYIVKWKGQKHTLPMQSPKRRSRSPISECEAQKQQMSY